MAVTTMQIIGGASRMAKEREGTRPVSGLLLKLGSASYVPLHESARQSSEDRGLESVRGRRGSAGLRAEHAECTVR